MAHDGAHFLSLRLGISNIKWELEDLCLRYLEPEFYYDLVEKVKQKRQERQRFIEDSILQIHTKLIRSGIKAEISGRAKHFYSIYRKMKRDNKDISEEVHYMAAQQTWRLSGNYSKIRLKVPKHLE